MLLLQEREKKILYFRKKICTSEKPSPTNKYVTEILEMIENRNSSMYLPLSLNQFFFLDKSDENYEPKKKRNHTTINNIFHTSRPSVNLQCKH